MLEKFVWFIFGSLWTDIFYLFTVGLCICYWRFFFLPLKRRSKEIENIITQIDSYANKEIGFDTLRMILNKNELISCTWKKYERSLIKCNDKVYSSSDAEEFFGSISFLSGSDAKFWSSLTGIFTGLGILGTFVGLTVGFYGLNFENTNAQELIQSIQGLINGANTAFMTSIAGLLCAIPFNFIHERTMAKFILVITDFQGKIDAVFPRKNLEEILLENQRKLEEEKVAINSMSEDIANNIGSQLNDTLCAINDNLDASIKKNFEPIFNELLSAIQQLNHSGIDGIVKGINDGAGNQMQDLAKAMSLTAEDMKGISTDLKSFVTGMKEQQQASLGEVVNQIENGITKLITTLEGSAQKTSNEHDQLVEDITRALNENIAKLAVAIEGMEEKLRSGSNALSEAGERNRKVVEAQGNELIQSMRSFIAAMQDQQKNSMGTMVGNIENATSRMVQALEQSAQNTTDDHDRLMKDITVALNDNIAKLTGTIDGMEEKLRIGSAALVDAGEKTGRVVAQKGNELTVSLDHAADKLNDAAIHLEGAHRELQDTFTKHNMVLDKSESIVDRATDAAGAFIAAAQPVQNVSDQLKQTVEVLPSVQIALREAGNVVKEAGNAVDAFREAAAPVKNVSGQLIQVSEQLPKVQMVLESMSNVSSNINTSMERIERVNSSIENSAQHIDATMENTRQSVEKIQNALDTTQEAWKAYESKLGTIRTDMDQIFKELHMGLDTYQNETRRNLGDTLQLFDSALAKAVGQLSGLADDIPDLTEAVKTLSDSIHNAQNK